MYEWEGLNLNKKELKKASSDALKELWLHASYIEYYPWEIWAEGPKTTTALDDFINERGRKSIKKQLNNLSRDYESRGFRGVD